MMIFFRLFLSGIFFIQTVFSAAQGRFLYDFKRKKTCIGACIGEENPEILSKMRKAEISCCAACCRCISHVTTGLTINRIAIPGACGYVIHGCSRVGHASLLYASCEDMFNEIINLAKLTQESYDRRASEIDRHLASDEYQRSSSGLIDERSLRLPAQHIMEMNPIHIRRVSQDLNPNDIPEDPTHLQ